MNATPPGWKDAPPGTVHLFGVVRVDLFQLPSDTTARPEACDSLVSGTRAFWERAEADRETERLNALNGPKGCRYVTVTLRVLPPVPPEKP